MFTVDGETMCMRDWAKRYNMHYDKLRYRINDIGMTPELALKTPPSPGIKIET